MFTCLQFFFTGLFCIPGALIFEDCTVEMMKAAIVPVLYAGIGICAAGYTLQMIGQKYVPSERATILLSTESLFSLFSGMLVLHEAMSVREYIGCALIFIAVTLVRPLEWRRVCREPLELQKGCEPCLLRPQMAKPNALSGHAC